MELTLLLAAYCQKRGIEPGEAIANLTNMLNKSARGPSVMEPTGQLKPAHYPMGNPLNPDDNGMGLARIEKRADGVVYVVLGEMVVNWFAITPGMAIELAKTLMSVAKGPPDMSLKAGEAPL